MSITPANEFIRRALCPALVWVALSIRPGAVAHAQNPQPNVSTLIGLGMQTDVGFTRGILLSPVGLIAGAMIGRDTKGYEIAASALMAWYPIGGQAIEEETAGGSSNRDRTESLLLSELAVDVGRSLTETGRVTLFGSAGAAGALRTPRDGHRVSPLIGAGVSWRLTARASLRASVRYYVQRVGETSVHFPIVVSIH